MMTDKAEKEAKKKLNEYIETIKNGPQGPKPNTPSIHEWAETIGLIGFFVLFFIAPNRLVPYVFAIFMIVSITIMLLDRKSK